MLAATAFVGRGSELDLLDGALASAEAGASTAVEIVGPAGIGKTRLLAELADRADARGFVALTGAGAEYEQDLPFWVFVDALDEYVTSLDPRRLERMDPAVRCELAQVLPSIAPGGETPSASLHERYRTHRAMRELLEQLAATRPLLLILDDFHWADHASTDLLVALLHRPPAAGVVLVVAARPRQLPQRLATALDRAHREGTLTRAELEPLTRDQARELVGADADRLFEECGGNPFYLEQLARAPGTHGGAVVDPSGGGVEVPRMVAAALAEELSLLSDPARRVLDAAAVAGDPFEVDLAAAAAAMSEPEVLEALDELTGIELLLPADTPRRFRFRHPIVRRAVYEGSPGGWRIAAHGRAAEALAARGASATARAHHVERSARQGDREAVAILREAAEESAARAPATAARLFAGAHRLLPADAPAQERVELLLPMGRALVATGQFEKGHASLVESIAIAPREAVALRADLASACARVEHLLGRHEQAHDRLLAALDELEDERTPEGVSLMIELTMDAIHRMNYPAMTAWGMRAAAAAEGLDDPVLKAAALAAVARSAAFPGLTEDADPRCAEAEAAVDALPDHMLARRLDALTHLAGAELYMHRFAASHAYAQRALDIGRATGQGNQFPLVYAMLGITWYFRGQLREAVDPLDGAIEAARLTGNAQAIVWSLYPRARIALGLGDVQLAMTLAQEAVDIIDDGKPSHHFSHSAIALAEAHLELGNADRAIELLDRAAGGPDAPLAAPSFRSQLLDVIVKARLMVGDRAGAEAAGAVAREIADSSPLPLLVAWADRSEALLALDRADAAQAAELALTAAELFAAGDVPLEAAASQSVAGRALAQAGERDRAIEVLQRAAHAFDERGATRHRDAAERELRQLGQRIHRRSQPTAAAGEGVDALTRRELEIARRIVDRQTNRQIAEELFLSPKTVETHIRNIFAKLGAGSRVEVARIVEQAERLASAS